MTEEMEIIKTQMLEEISKSNNILVNKIKNMENQMIMIRGEN